MKVVSDYQTIRSNVIFYEIRLGIAGSDSFAVVNLSGQLDFRFFDNSVCSCNKLAYFAKFENKRYEQVRTSNRQSCPLRKDSFQSYSVITLTYNTGQVY